MRAFILIGVVAVIAAGGCKKKSSSVPVAKLEPIANKVTVESVVPVLDPPKLDDEVPEKPAPKPPIVENPAPIIGGGGAALAVRGSAKKTVKEEHLRYIHILVENASGAIGRMPTTETTYAALKQETPETAALVYEKLIVLHPAKNREEIWAYEAKALESGGLCATHQGVETLDAATLKRRLGH